MCGISGIFYRNGRSVDHRLLERMTEALRHRGPDGGDTWTEGPIGLGHRRLSIRDLSDAGRQPFKDNTGRIVVSYNGEIYNYPELKAELESGYGATFTTTCDTEIIPYGYLAWGEEVFNRLEGMFSIALWDRTRNTLFLARDGIGIKPLFYSANAEVIRFGSEIKALLADGEQSRTISPEGLHRFLAMGYVGPSLTTLESIHQVPPGTVMSFTSREVKERRYWTPNREPRIRRLEEAVEAFKPLWSRVMEDHLASDVPVGVLQSGGVDSTLVSLEANRAKPTPLFTAQFSNGDFDESGDAMTVSEWLGTPLHTITVDGSNAAEDVLKQVIRQYDGQNCDEASIPLFLLCNEIRKYVTVGLTGDGGDETFGGYPTYRASRFAAALTPFAPRQLWKAIGRLSYGLGGSNEGRLPLSAIVSRLALGLGDGPSQAHTQWRRLVPAFQMPSLYGPLMRDVAENDPFVEYKSMLAAPGPLLDRCLVADQRFHLPSGLLIKSDAMSMAHGLELRVPFLDRRIVDFAGSCDGPLLTNLKGDTKRVLRTALEQLGGPAAISRAPKRGFNVPIAQLLRTALRSTADQFLESRAETLAPYLNPQAVRMLWRQHRDREFNHAYTLWPILHFSIWKQSLSETTSHSAGAPRRETEVSSDHGVGS